MVPEPVESVAPLIDKGLVVEAFLNHGVEHPEKQGNICSRSDLKPHIGLSRNRYTTGIDDDQFRIVLPNRLQDVTAPWGMGNKGVPSADQDAS